jgi:ubiquinone/menaquinone biosynthesis C-methylase UbiE
VRGFRGGGASGKKQRMASHRDTIVDQFSRQAVPFSLAAPIRDEGALRLLVEATRAGRDDTVLDVACGPGLVACAFAREVRDVTGVDLTPAMIHRARALATQQGLANVAFHVGDVSPLAFPDGAFSIVVARFAFHHFLDPAAVLAEMRRVCRPGGRVAVADLMASPDPARAAAFHRMEILRDPSHARALTLVEQRALFAAAGFAPPEESFWRMDIDVQDLLSRSFPEPGTEDTIRRLFEESIATDAFGLDTRREEGRLRFTYSNVILCAER